MPRHVIQQQTYEVTKAGTIIESLSNPGPGWLECDGKSLFRSAYPLLAELMPNPGLKFKTTDLSSQLTLAPTGGYRPRTFATDTTLFYMFSTTGIYFRSVDNGITWTYYHTPFNLNYRMLHKLSTGRLILTSSREGPPLYSDDDGVTWEQSSNMPVSPPLCVYCVANDVLYMVKQGLPNLYRSEDLINWTTLSLNLTNWRPYSGYLWSSIIVSSSDNSGYVDLMFTVSDSNFGLEILTYDSWATFSTYELISESKYLGYYDSPTDVNRINFILDNWTYSKLYYQNVLNNTVNVFDTLSYQHGEILKLEEISSAAPLQIVDNTIVVFNQGLTAYPCISHDGKTFSKNYGINLPTNFNCGAVQNNKIYYFAGYEQPDWLAKVLVTLEFDPLLFNLPGIKSDNGLKYYISTGQ